MRKRNYWLMGGLAAVALGMWWRGRRQEFDTGEEFTEYGTVIYRNMPLP